MHCLFLMFDVNCVLFVMCWLLCVVLCVLFVMCCLLCVDDYYVLCVVH